VEIQGGIEGEMEVGADWGSEEQMTGTPATKEGMLLQVELIPVLPLINWRLLGMVALKERSLHYYHVFLRHLHRSSSLPPPRPPRSCFEAPETVLFQLPIIDVVGVLVKTL
jgi:hypothetical protein